MPDDSRNPFLVTVAVGASMALFATFLPWYSYNVVLPVAGVVHIFAVTTTLWGFTTLAPTLIIVGSMVALLCAVLVSRPLANFIAELIAVALIVYAAVRCFDIPNLGVALGGIPALTELEGGPFVELAGGLILGLGALADMVTAPAGAGRRSWLSDRTRSRAAGPSVRPPHAAA